MGTLLVVAGMVAPAAGQEPPPGQEPAVPEVGPEGKAPAPAPVDPNRPSNAAFMKPLGRLSTILGAVHFLRKLCGDANADLWRDTMNALLDAQSPGEADRRILVARFNGGYRAFESTYRQCTPAARLAVTRYQGEGAALAREISARYGN